MKQPTCPATPEDRLSATRLLPGGAGSGIYCRCYHLTVSAIRPFGVLGAVPQPCRGSMPSAWRMTARAAEKFQALWRGIHVRRPFPPTSFIARRLTFLVSARGRAARRRPSLGAGRRDRFGGHSAASYTTLKGAFDAINAGTHQGVIGIGISGNTTETATGGDQRQRRGRRGLHLDRHPADRRRGALDLRRDRRGQPADRFQRRRQRHHRRPQHRRQLADHRQHHRLGDLRHRDLPLHRRRHQQHGHQLEHPRPSSSASVATNGGTIFFSTDAVTTSGNDNNTISNNNIGPAGANLPSKAILCNGSTAHHRDRQQRHHRQQQQHLRLLRRGRRPAPASPPTPAATPGRSPATGSTRPPPAPGPPAPLHTPIDIRPTTATSGAQGFTVTGNIIGFASNTQTGVYTLTGAGTGAKFHRHPVQRNHRRASISNINNNTVAAVSLTGVTSSGTTSACAVHRHPGHQRPGQYQRQHHRQPMRHRVAGLFDHHHHGHRRPRHLQFQRRRLERQQQQHRRHLGHQSRRLRHLRARPVPRPTPRPPRSGNATEQHSSAARSPIRSRLTSTGAASQVVGMSTTERARRPELERRPQPDQRTTAPAPRPPPR